MTIVSHIIFALFAVGFGTRNLIAIKGDNKHKVIGWIWVLLMFYVAISSYWIKELNDGNYSWIHILSAWTLISLFLAIYFIKIKKVILHKIFMAGNFIGLIAAGIFTLLPGRYLPNLIGIF